MDRRIKCVCVVEKGDIDQINLTVLVVRGKYPRRGGVGHAQVKHMVATTVCRAISCKSGMFGMNLLTDLLARYFSSNKNIIKIINGSCFSNNQNDDK